MAMPHAQVVARKPKRSIPEAHMRLFRATPLLRVEFSSKLTSMKKAHLSIWPRKFTCALKQLNTKCCFSFRSCQSCQRLPWDTLAITNKAMLLSIGCRSENVTLQQVTHKRKVSLCPKQGTHHSARSSEFPSKAANWKETFGIWIRITFRITCTPQPHTDLWLLSKASDPSGQIKGRDCTSRIRAHTRQCVLPCAP